MSTKMNMIVNEEVYTNLVLAKRNIEFLLKRGKVSAQMESMGTKLSSDDKEYIDYNIYGLYHAIDKYITCYEDRDFEECFYAGQFIKQNYEAGLNKEYLFEIMIRNQLPEAYNANLSYDEFGNCLNSRGNIRLTNGNTLHVIGKKDLLTNDSSEDDYISQSKWLASLPDLLLGHYTVIRDIEDPNMCYICNDVLTEKMLDEEWRSLKAEGKVMYRIPGEVRIGHDIDTNGFYFEDKNGNIIDEMSMNQAYRANQILYINDSLLIGQGNLDLLDNYLSNIEKHKQQVYIRK